MSATATRSVFDPAARAELVRRMETVTPERRPRWGKMKAEQMLAHVNAGMEMATGDRPTKPKFSPFAHPLGRWLAIYKMPWPKGAPTAPELLVPPSGSWDEQLSRFRELLEQVGALSGRTEWPRHPAFGRLTTKQWGDLSYRHTDHHLQQFGA